VIGGDRLSLAGRCQPGLMDREGTPGRRGHPDGEHPIVLIGPEPGAHPGQQ